MCGLRQSLWRLPEEEVGDPSATDRLPEAGTTKLTWTSTDKMLADPLTKGMKHDGLKRLMDGFEVDMSPTLDGLRAKKEYGCEMEHVDLAESSLHAVDAAVADATGIDISPEMLSKAMSSVAVAMLRQNIVPWTPILEAPVGIKDMGSWKAVVYTQEQQQRLGVGEFGQRLLAASGRPPTVAPQAPHVPNVPQPVVEDMGTWKISHFGYTSEQEDRLGSDHHCSKCHGLPVSPPTMNGSFGKAVLNSPALLKGLCQRYFRSYDMNRNNSLELDELHTLCDDLHIGLGMSMSLFTPEALKASVARFSGGDKLSAGEFHLWFAEALKESIEVVDLKKRFEGLEDEAFDLTLCLGTLTYMSPEDMTLTELCRVTKKGGYVVFSMRTDLCEKWEAAQAALEQKGVWTHLGTSEGFDYLPANPEYGNTILVKVYVYQVA
ncbi:unnamed protein product [Durusdinium trenchii]|uniref:EF-hand domain-containing protein n=1 Tax=Durusdinium trenchii TaxID=1381693 RepID=A0ABP0PKK2_9DINO